jgi:hypothetical protein
MIERRFGAGIRTIPKNAHDSAGNRDYSFTAHAM